MANPRQKLKNRSSVSKVRHKPKSKKKIFNNPVIAANWDKTQTLTQNYERLGLSAKINKITGGKERNVTAIEREKEETGDGVEKHDSLRISGRGARPDRHIEVQEAKIERDPITGSIVRIIGDEAEERRRANPLNDPLRGLNSDSDSDVDAATGRRPTKRRAALFDQHGADTSRERPTKAGKTQVVRELEEQASRPTAKHKRRQPDGERDFVEELVRKYGDDVARMARDTKINYMQRSEGDIRRRIKRWQDEGGSIAELSSVA